MADISKITIESGTYDIKDATSRSNITSLSTEVTNLSNSIKNINSLKDKKTLIMGDSLCLSGKWGDYFVTYSGCDGEVYGNGSAGFLSKGVTAPYYNMDFNEMLNSIISQKTSAELLEFEYIIVGGGINDALNSYTPTNISNAVADFISNAKTNFPNAKIIIIPIHTFKWLKNIELKRYTSIIESAKNNGVETTGNFIFWKNWNNDYNSGDDVHLTDAGYQVLAHYLLSYINGTQNTDIQSLDYTFKANWSKLVHFSIYKKDNIVYIKGCLHYNGTLTSSSEILTFDLGNYVTGSSNYNIFIPCLFYTSGSQIISFLQVQNGILKMGYPQNFTSLVDPYIYINGSYTIGISGDD